MKAISANASPIVFQSSFLRTIVDRYLMITRECAGGLTNYRQKLNICNVAWLSGYREGQTDRAK